MEFEQAKPSSVVNLKLLPDALADFYIQYRILL